MGSTGPTPWVADLRSVVEALDDDHPILVGASMGGAISLVAIGEGQVDASAIVLVDIAPRIEVAGESTDRRVHGAEPRWIREPGGSGRRYLPFPAHRPPPPKPWMGRPKPSGWVPTIDTTGIGIRPSGRPTATRRARRPGWSGPRPGCPFPPLSCTVSVGRHIGRGRPATSSRSAQAEYVNVAAAHMIAGDRNDIFTGAVIDFLDVHCRQARDHPFSR